SSLPVPLHPEVDEPILPDPHRQLPPQLSPHARLGAFPRLEESTGEVPGSRVGRPRPPREQQTPAPHDERHGRPHGVAVEGPPTPPTAPPRASLHPHDRQPPPALAAARP